jgi:hypothetical protein
VFRSLVEQREALAHNRVSRTREPPLRPIGGACEVSPQRIHIPSVAERPARRLVRRVSVRQVPPLTFALTLTDPIAR